MQPVRCVRSWVQSLQLRFVTTTEAIRSGTWKEHQYQLLLGAQQKSQYYYSQNTKRKSTITGAITTILVLLYIFSHPLLYLTPFDERACEHPVIRLVHDAEQALNKTLGRQSKSLDEAVAEYQRRYKMPPPPNFDKWYTFATSRKTVLIDEYDTIYHTLLPFWGLAPSTIRSRVREDLGYDNIVMGIAIRDGRATHLGNGQGRYQRDATMTILDKFSQWLPDMNLEFNVHDEPRVVVPHEELHMLVSEGYAAHARLSSNSSLLNQFSRGDTNDPVPPALVSTTRFNDIQRQETWLSSRVSCPLDTPARSLDDNAPDNSSAYAVGPLGFVFNQTAASDVCNSPSLRHRLGLFGRPESFKVTSELVPMFSMSHPSSFQDIAVPSPWYYENISKFDPETSVQWEEKKPQLYWRGKTNGGHSQNGSWRNLQRQRIIGNLTHPQSPQYIMQPKNDSSCGAGHSGTWEVQIANRSQIKEYFNTHFIEIVACDDDCDEEKEFFHDIAQSDPQSEAWKYRYLLDMDGHGYSGRFYAFMRSKSVPFKLTFFREWHEDVLIPWVHYVPINKDGDEIPELMRFFEEDPAGQQIARSIGEGGQAWAARTIRNEDMDVYMFRLFLEYARVQDDQRENLGFRL
ncbi:Lipopolysaccharide-modifying protein [Penicillium concentricum]|uniref:Lipopolysaccharide-modifying protein n=1 Tax=Penicillium concentricum TaxID=293559 RepID=A0A9W9RSP4_9EURO|nr:Lipopolysaccharide-modifying protein [Penicillium concentricum]KAJ5365690.1 Lipopolysaccharide-modifying protein [Penicillium concentricum]